MNAGAKVLMLLLACGLLGLGFRFYQDSPSSTEGRDSGEETRGLPESRQVSADSANEDRFSALSGRAPSDVVPGGAPRSPAQRADAEKMESLAHDPRAPVVLGAPLDRKTAQDLRTQAGMERFIQQFSGAQDHQASLVEIQYAWDQMEGRSLQEREALVLVTAGLIRVTGSEDLKNRLLKEYDEFSPFSTSRSSSSSTLGYAEKALQTYLDYEPSQERWEEEMRKRGIPVIRSPASVTPLDGRADAPGP